MEESVRELSMSELELVSGGYNTDHWEPPYDLGELDPVTPGGGGGGGGWDWGDWGDWGDYGDGGGGGGGGGGDAAPDCTLTNPITGIVAPDGATYYSPEGVDGKYIVDAINHLRAQTSLEAKVIEFNKMYTQPSHPHFIDFKDWGTSNGPPGSVSGGTTTYWSEARGEYYTGSVFEAFGNYAYGFIGHLGGIPVEVLRYAAGFTQTGAPDLAQYLGFWADAPEDRPHVAKGLADAESYNLIPREIFGVNTTNCGG